MERRWNSKVPPLAGFFSSLLKVATAMERHVFACVCRGQLGAGAAGHQHGLHLWTVHLRGHPAGQQRVSAAVPRRSAAHTLHQQVRGTKASRLFSDGVHVKQLCLLCSLQGRLDLNSILEKAESHVYNYCKRCTRDYMSGQCSAHDGRGDDFLYLLRSLLVLKWHRGFNASFVHRRGLFFVSPLKLFYHFLFQRESDWCNTPLTLNLTVAAHYVL